MRVSIFSYCSQHSYKYMLKNSALAKIWEDKELKVASLLVPLLVSCLAVHCTIWGNPMEKETGPSLCMGVTIQECDPSNPACQHPGLADLMLIRQQTGVQSQKG